MFDGLRNDAKDTSGFDDGQIEFFPEENPAVVAAPRRRSSGKILGLTAQQRFLLAFMLLMAVCTVGAMIMFWFGKFVL